MHHHIKFGYKSWAVQKTARTHGQTDTAIPVTPPPQSNKERQEIIGFTSAQHTHISNLTFQTKYRNCQNSAIACCLFLYPCSILIFCSASVERKSGHFLISVLLDSTPLIFYISLPSVVTRKWKYIIYVYVYSLYTRKRENRCGLWGWEEQQEGKKQRNNTADTRVANVFLFSNNICRLGVCIISTELELEHFILQGL